MGSIKDKAFAGDLSAGGTKITAANAVAVATTDVNYSDTFEVEDCSYGLEVQFDSDGDVDVDVIMEQGNTPLLDSEQGSANANYVVPYGKSVVNVADKLVNIIPISMAVTKYARVKVAGGAGNDATTEMTKCKIVRI